MFIKVHHSGHTKATGQRVRTETPAQLEGETTTRRSTPVERLTTPLENLKIEIPSTRVNNEHLHAIREDASKKRDEILKSELRHVLDRGRETRPTAPVRRDSAEAIREREDALETMAVGELDRRRETRPSAPEEVPTAHRGVPQGTSTQ